MVREQAGYLTAVNLDNSAVDEILGKDPQFKGCLPNTGDMAVKISGEMAPFYVKGCGVGRDDIENMKIMESMAKAWYKMGFEQEVGSQLGCAYNRNEKEVQEKLKGNKNEIQIDI